MALDLKVVISTLNQSGPGISKSVTDLNKLKTASEQLEKQFEGMVWAGERMQSVGLGMMAAGGAVVGAFGLMTRSASEFNRRMAEVSTLVDTSIVDMKALSGGITDLAIDTGVSADSLTGALYQALSAGVNASKATGFLGVAARAAVGGVTDVTTAVDGLTSVVNAWGMKTEDASKVADGMFSAVKAGKTTFGELSASMFNVAPAAAAANIGMEEVLAAISTLTASGTPTSVATTQIRAALVGLMRPSEDLNAIFGKVGFATAEAAVKSKGLKFALDTVMEGAAGSSGKLTELLGSVEAVQAAQVLAGTGASKFAADLKSQSEAAGAADEAFKKMEQSQSFAKLKEAGLALARVGSDAVLPMMREAADWAGKAAKAFKEWMDKHPGLTSALGKSALAGGSLLVAVGGIIFIVGKAIAAYKIYAETLVLVRAANKVTTVSFLKIILPILFLTETIGNLIRLYHLYGEAAEALRKGDWKGLEELSNEARRIAFSLAPGAAVFTGFQGIKSLLDEVDKAFDVTDILGVDTFDDLKAGADKLKASIGNVRGEIQGLAGDIKGVAAEAGGGATAGAVGAGPAAAAGGGGGITMGGIAAAAGALASAYKAASGGGYGGGPIREVFGPGISGYEVRSAAGGTRGAAFQPMQAQGPVGNETLAPRSNAEMAAAWLAQHPGPAYAARGVGAKPIGIGQLYGDFGREVLGWARSPAGRAALVGGTLGAGVGATAGGGIGALPGMAAGAAAGYWGQARRDHQVRHSGTINVRLDGDAANRQWTPEERRRFERQLGEAIQAAAYGY